jgi:hypothetical protein
MRTITEDAGSLAPATVVAGRRGHRVAGPVRPWAAAHLGDRRRHLARGTSSDAAKAVVIRLADERYARLVVGVDDPAQTVAAIRQALGTTG